MGQAQTIVAGKARAVRYVEKMVLNVELRSESSGQIYPPFLDITYSSATIADFQENKKVQVDDNYILWGPVLFLCNVESCRHLLHVMSMEENPPSS